MLLDTSGLLCLYDAHDFRHGGAETLYRAADRVVTHGYVLAEFISLAHVRHVPRPGALAFMIDLLDNPVIDVVWGGRGAAPEGSQSTAESIG